MWCRGSDRSRFTRLVGLTLSLLLIVAFGQSHGQGSKKLETVPITKQADPASGPELYRAYCASCHGLDAKGGGPVAESMRMRPTDLTQLTRNNNGKFPAFRVQQLLGGSDEVPAAHGTRTMPVWGPVFRQMNRDEGLAALRVKNLTSYLESVQAK